MCCDKYYLGGGGGPECIATYITSHFFLGRIYINLSNFILFSNMVYFGLAKQIHKFYHTSVHIEVPPDHWCTHRNRLYPST